MVLYKDNQTLKLKTIITNTGETEYLKNCKKFDTIYYKIEDCIQIGIVYYPKNHPNLEKNWETNEYFIKENGIRVLRGVVAVENDVVQYGYFTPNPNNNVPCYNEQTGVRETILNANVIVNCKNFVENVSQGVIYYNPGMTENTRKAHKNIQNCYDWTVKKYNLEDNNSEYKKKLSLYQNYNHEEKIPAALYAKYLNYSFGFEFEVGKGFIPDYMQNRHGLVICRDGSIDGGGPEFVTVPLSGRKGVSSLIQLCDFAKDRVVLDMSCSTHLHLGGFPHDKKLLVALYLLSYSIQDELFAMLPPYKKYWEGFKKKNYCKFLDNMNIKTNPDMDSRIIHQNYSDIITFLSDFRINYDQYHEGMKHPSGHKWDIENRKYWINLVNIAFGERRTIEFRAHQATFNPTKTINWLYINNAILSYTVKFADSILSQPTKTSFYDVLNYYKSTHPEDEEAVFLSNYLTAYYDDCRLKFDKAFIEKDYTCHWDLKDDPEYTFKLNEKDLLV